MNTQERSAHQMSVEKRFSAAKPEDVFSSAASKKAKGKLAQIFGLSEEEMEKNLRYASVMDDADHGHCTADLLERTLAGTLSAAEQQIVDRHLETCSVCRSCVDEFRRTDPNSDRNARRTHTFVTKVLRTVGLVRTQAPVRAAHRRAIEAKKRESVLQKV